MEQSKGAGKKLHPRERANIISKLFFLYTIPIFRKGFKKDLVEEDLYEVLKPCRSKDLGDELELEWEMDKKKHKKPSIVRALWAMFGRTYIWLGIMQLGMRTLMALAVPQAVGKLVSYFSPNQTEITLEEAYYYAAIVIGCNIFNHIFTHNYLMALQELGIRIRTAICSFIYRKALRMTDAALAEVTMGKIVTLITKDLFAIEILVFLANEIWISLVLAVLITVLIYLKIGIAGFVGTGFFLAILPLQIIVGKMASSLRLKTSKKTDERLHFTNELLTTIKTIKMYSWEDFYKNKISQTRRKEVNSMFVLFYLKVMIIVVGNLAGKIGFYLLIMTYVWLGNYVTAEIVYFVMTCFGKMKHLLSILLPLGITYTAEVHATLTRLKTVIDAEEISSSCRHTNVPNKEPKIFFSNATVTIKDSNILNNITLEISKGLNFLIGHIGSGKTTFLKTILGNFRIDGNVNVNGKISYASQEPWLFPATIKSNILFGHDYNSVRYKKVLEICALNQDFKSFPDGDASIVGDNGTNLSKGQQARVNLARAIYKDADIYLLDDCLAALDSHVSDHIFKECVIDFLRNKLVILVSNNSEHIQAADQVIQVTKGSAKFLENHQKKAFENTRKKEEVLYTSSTEKNVTDLYTEEKKCGVVDGKTYKRYVKFGGGYILVGFIIFMFAGTQGIVSYSDKLVSQWVTVEQNLSSYKVDGRTETNEYQKLEEKRTNLLNWYTIMIVSATVISLLRSFIFFCFNRKASINLHKKMISSIIRAKMLFFDSHFIGNILNRFSKDLATVDEHLPFVMSECFDLLFVAAGILFLVATVNTFFSIAAGVLIAVAYLFRFIYLRTGRSLQRMDASTRSPLIGHLNASLEGLSTIRAFKAQDMIREEFDKHQDLYTSVNYTLQNCVRSLGFMLDGMCSLFITVVILAFLFMKLDTTVGNVGLAISQAFHLTGLLQYGIKRWADFETQMTSVERALGYTEVEKEPNCGKKVDDWPNKGKIIYDKVSMRYSQNRPILRDITFTIEGNNKVGIVGRTGAGKSSIISTLFRLYDVQGDMLIDGVKTKDVSLRFLRSKISIIPQDPVLITGTIRENIDPLNKCKDDEIWKAIKITNLQGVVTNLAVKIDSNSNFSSGQKQLICLARALVRKNKIVVLDEATANLDNETDNLMREVIKEHFSSCTVITIAHRLSSVLEADVVMVIDNGQIVEEDSPSKLLLDKESLFFDMIKTT